MLLFWGHTSRQSCRALFLLCLLAPAWYILSVQSRMLCYLSHSSPYPLADRNSADSPQRPHKSVICGGPGFQNSARAVPACGISNYEPCSYGLRYTPDEECDEPTSWRIAWYSRGMRTKDFNLKSPSTDCDPQGASSRPLDCLVVSAAEGPN